MSDISPIMESPQDRADRWRSWRPGPLHPGRSIRFVLEVAFLARITAANIVEWRVQRRGTSQVCIFPDADYYWKLGQTIVSGELFQIVEWGDIPHFALRTPGYPAFLAACQAIGGGRPLAARLVQALLGAATVWLVFRLMRTIEVGEGGRGVGTIPDVAAALTAVQPYFILMSAVLLSEVLFVPLMLLSLWGMASIWKDAVAYSTRSHRRECALAIGIGMASGAAILVRPSWAMSVPILLASWAVCEVPRRSVAGRMRLARRFILVTMGLVAVMAPWWIRNERIYGRFIPTAIWLGASLYDGINPSATGASDMRFLADPEFWPLDELDQDAALTREAVAFAWRSPGRVLDLAAIKFGRYWSPWPNAEGLQSPWLAATSALVTVPLLALMGLGLYERRRDPRAWILLAGPVFYFCALHMVFASSMRYRIPGEVPAMGLAAVGAERLTRRWRRG